MKPYSFWADWLSKFHTASEFIQALWIMAVVAVLLGVPWVLMRGIASIIPLLSSRRVRCLRIDGVYHGAGGRRMIHRHGATPPDMPWDTPPPGLIGRGQAGEDAIRRSEGERR